MAKLGTKVKTESSTRTTVREKIGNRLSDLLENIDLLVREIERQAHKRVLAVVEDLDKADLAPAKDIFYNYAASLTAPRCSIIYTFPTALRHDDGFMQIQQSFPDPISLPNFKVTHRDGTDDEDGLVALESLLTKRAEENLFTPEALMQLAKLSGGLPRGLVTLTRRACLLAMAAKKPAIDTPVVEQAAARMRLDYQVLLTSRTEQLQQVDKTKKVSNTEEHRALLHNLSVLEYRNDEGVWYDVHPIVKPLLKAE